MIVFNEEATNSLDIELLLSQAQEKLANEKLKTAKVHNIFFSFSYVLTKFEKEEVEIVLNKADELMYKIKKVVENFKFSFVKIRIYYKRVCGSTG